MTCTYKDPEYIHILDLPEGVIAKIISFEHSDGKERSYKGILIERYDGTYLRGVTPSGQLRVQRDGFQFWSWALDARPFIRSHHNSFVKVI